MDLMINKVEQHNKREDGDYIGDDNLLRCGRCHEPKWAIIDGYDKPCPIACACKQKAEEEYKQKERREAIERNRRECFGAAVTWASNSTFAKDKGYNAKATAIAKNYVNKFDELRKDGLGLLLYGTVGAGKSFYSAAVANALIDAGYRVKAGTFGELYREELSERDKSAFLQNLSRYDLVVLDDLGAEQSNATMKGFVFAVIDSLYKANTPFIVTTNLSADELTNPRDDTSVRVFDRILERCPAPIEIETKAGSVRRQKIREAAPQYRNLLGI